MIHNKLVYVNFLHVLNSLFHYYFSSLLVYLHHFLYVYLLSLFIFLAFLLLFLYLLTFLLIILDFCFILIIIIINHIFPYLSLDLLFLYHLLLLNNNYLISSLGFLQHNLNIDSHNVIQFHQMMSIIPKLLFYHLLYD